MDKPFELNTIYNEDCMDTMSRMADSTVDVVFTSPPYNRKRDDTYTHHQDIRQDYLAFLIQSTNEMLRVAPTVFINIQSNYYNKIDLLKYMGHYADKIVQTFVWTKENPMPAQGHNITNAFEYIFMLGQPRKSSSTYTKNHIHTSVNPDTDKEHGAIMHKKVAQFFIYNFTSEQETIYDPFMGSGTTAKICQDSGRNYIGSEISAEYCLLCEQKLAQQSLLAPIQGEK